MNINIMTFDEAIKYILLLRNAIPQKFDYPDKLVEAVDMALDVMLEKKEAENED